MLTLRSVASVLSVLAAAAVLAPAASADLMGKQVFGVADINNSGSNYFNSNSSDPSPHSATVADFGVEFSTSNSFGSGQYQADVGADRVTIMTINSLSLGDARAPITITLSGLNYGGNTMVTSAAVLSSTHNGGPGAIGITILAPGTIRIDIPGGGIAACSNQTTIVTFGTGVGNDSCANAIPIGLGATAFSTVNATTDGLNHPGMCNFFASPGIAHDIWYTHTAAADGTLTVSTCGSAFDTELAVYSAGACPGTDATLLACNDDTAACGNNNSQTTVNVTAGSMYLIRVGGYDGGAPPPMGAGTLTLTAVTTGACCNRWTGHCVVQAQAPCLANGLRFDGLGSACSVATCKACPADFNGGAGLEVQDIFDFLNSWFAGCP